MTKITIVQGHPDASPARLNASLAERYAQVALAAGHQVRRINVAAIEFPLLRTYDAFYREAPPEAIRSAQCDIAWADHLVFFFPLWIGDVPALFKAFIEQTFRPGFAVELDRRGRWVRKPLAGKSARLVVTMGMPALVFKTLYHARVLESLRSSLAICGIAPVRYTVIGGVENASASRRRRWFGAIKCAAEEDGRVRRRSLAATAAAAACGAALAGAVAYATSVATAWVRFGGDGSRAPVLLDEVMPRYDLALRHERRIDAPARCAFEAIAVTELERSPIVATLFRMRARLLGASTVEQEMPRGLPALLERIGWRVAAAQPGRELVFAAVTQPWLANPVFRGLDTADFVRFAEPGFVKIAFNVRIEEDGSARCLARTETRVLATDAQSRARFRRYWALTAPGIALVRVVLLAQLKAAAELRASLAPSLKDS